MNIPFVFRGSVLIGYMLIRSVLKGLSKSSSAQFNQIFIIPRIASATECSCVKAWYNIIRFISHNKIMSL